LGRRTAAIGCDAVASHTTLPSASYSTTLLLLYWGMSSRPLGSTSRLPIATLPIGKLFSSLPTGSSRRQVPAEVVQTICPSRNLWAAIRSPLGRLIATTSLPDGSTSRICIRVAMKVLPLGSRWQLTAEEPSCFCQRISFLRLRSLTRLLLY